MSCFAAHAGMHVVATVLLLRSQVVVGVVLHAMPPPQDQALLCAVHLAVHPMWLCTLATLITTSYLHSTRWLLTNPSMASQLAAGLDSSC